MPLRAVPPPSAARSTRKASRCCCATLSRTCGRPWRDAALWLRDNPQARGKVLFHSRWDVFPDFIFYAPNCDYIVGMDPNYLLAHDVGKSRLYWDIFEDKVDSTTVDRIRREFGASFILVMPPHTPGLDRECRGRLGRPACPGPPRPAHRRPGRR